MLRNCKASISSNSILIVVTGIMRQRDSVCFELINVNTLLFQMGYVSKFRSASCDKMYHCMHN